MGIISSRMEKSESAGVSIEGSLAGAPNREESAMTSIKRWMRDDRNWAGFIGLDFTKWFIWTFKAEL
jgi:hypothetical protein